ncbi:MAG: 30S ribosome-binding factor RbfA [Hyphomicrobiales bacterium]
MNAPKMPSQRQLRIGEIIRKALSESLTRGEVRDPVLETSVVSVSEVKMSADLKIATVYIAPLGPQDIKAIVKALSENAKFLRGRIAKALSLKYTPNLRFQVDNSFDEYAKVDALLRSPKVARDLERQTGYGDED